MLTLLDPRLERSSFLREIAVRQAPKDEADDAAEGTREGKAQGHG
jgi:hypothetical protein